MDDQRSTLASQPSPFSVQLSGPSPSLSLSLSLSLITTVKLQFRKNYHGCRTLMAISHYLMEGVEREKKEGESTENMPTESASGGVVVSLFEDSVEKFISTMEAISLLCGIQDEPLINMKWRYFFYEPKIVNFVYEAEPHQSKEEIKGIELPQFSSAAPPNRGQPLSAAESMDRKDFVLHAGGSVWALDWCPRVHQVPHCPVRCEYLAVAAHPPGSSYHQIGAPLTGRGVIQIWCLLDMNRKEENYSQRSRERPTKGSARRSGGLSIKSEHPPKPRGRPTKMPLPVEPLGDGNSGLISNPPRKRGRPRKVPVAADSLNVSTVVNGTVPSKRQRGRPRKIPGNTETIDYVDVGSKLDKEKLVPVLGVADAHDENKSPQRHTDGRPRNIPEQTENVDHFDGEKNLINPEIGSYDATDDLNGKTTLIPCKRRGRPRKKPVRIEDACTNVVEDGKTKSSSLRKSRGRSGRLPDKKSDVGAPCIIEDVSSIECVSTPSVNVSNIERKSSPPKKDGEKLKQGSEEYVSDANGAEPIYPDQQEFPLVVNDSEVSCLAENVEPMKELYDLPRTNSFANAVSVSSSEVVSKEFIEDDIVCLNAQNDIALPRVFLCLGHNGKVAWDVKWRPCNNGDVNFRHRLGYLAAVLGNGSLEVWEIPSPSIIKNIYKSSFKEDTDPRFVKLCPVFRCSEVKFGDRQSIPLTLEWSKSTPDLILVGCHDGTVALWKFSAEIPLKVLPLLCFTADNVPIRAVSWAPGESYSQSSNVVVTAGHEGIKFWDIRDPYRPLWDFNPAQKMILSLDWLQQPSCLIFSFDDGTMKTLSLSKAACDVHVTGKPFDGAKHGVCSHFGDEEIQIEVWPPIAVQMGPFFAFRFDPSDSSITEKSVDKDKSRYRSPHYLCGALMEAADPQSLTVITPLPHTAIPDLPRRARGVPPHSTYAPPPRDDPQEQGEDPGEDLEHPGVDQPARRKPASKTRKKSQGVDFVEEEQEDLQAGATRSSDQDFLAFPPKIVAMHRVRWNTNEGSQRWLCSGGASGIIRCQVIHLPDS
ncbi:unnamed protein product [Spirodela intermedia]|uniref:Uncharacterized protein n=1 Tax=Spirodela intermedia TaxID=51605 RepID=A0A7I8JSK9_SPIIN|nr:unnamed protein product [Spirodela intermedia]CAA6673104.1 unnamed protein product [Spirodela intermedia]